MIISIPAHRYVPLSIEQTTTRLAAYYGWIEPLFDSSINSWHPSTHLLGREGGPESEHMLLSVGSQVCVQCGVLVVHAGLEVRDIIVIIIINHTDGSNNELSG